MELKYSQIIAVDHNIIGKMRERCYSLKHIRCYANRLNVLSGSGSTTINTESVSCHRTQHIDLI